MPNTNPNTMAQMLNAIVTAGKDGDVMELDNLETIVQEWLIDDLQLEAMQNVLDFAREFIDSV